MKASVKNSTGAQIYNDRKALSGPASRFAPAAHLDDRVTRICGSVGRADGM